MPMTPTRTSLAAGWSGSSSHSFCCCWRVVEPLLAMMQEHMQHHPFGHPLGEVGVDDARHRDRRQVRIDEDMIDAGAEREDRREIREVRQGALADATRSPRRRIEALSKFSPRICTARPGNSAASRLRQPSGRIDGPATRMAFVRHEGRSKRAVTRLCGGRRRLFADRVGAAQPRGRGLGACGVARMHDGERRAGLDRSCRCRQGASGRPPGRSRLAGGCARRRARRRQGRARACRSP